MKSRILPEKRNLIVGFVVGIALLNPMILFYASSHQKQQQMQPVKQEQYIKTLDISIADPIRVLYSHQTNVKQ